MFGNFKDAFSALKEYLILSEKTEQNKQEIARIQADYNKSEKSLPPPRTDKK